MTKHLTLLLFIGLAFWVCAGGSSDYYDFIQPDPKPTEFVGIGKAKEPSILASKEVATQRARLDIVQKVETCFYQIMKNYFKEAGVRDSKKVLEYFQIVKKEAELKVMNQSVINKAEVNNDRTVYVMVTLSLNVANEIFHNTYIKVLESEHEKTTRHVKWAQGPLRFPNVENTIIEDCIESQVFPGPEFYLSE